MKINAHSYSIRVKHEGSLLRMLASKRHGQELPSSARSSAKR